MNDDFLRAELQRAAAEHEPDRTVMLNRIAAGRTSSRNRVWRLAAAALSVTTVLGVGGVARWALAGEHEPAPPVAVAPPVPSSSPTNSPSPSHVTASHSRTPSASPPSHTPSTSPSAVRGHPGDTQVQKGSLWSDGSVDPAGTDTEGQSDVTLKASSALSALDLTIRVTTTAGLASTGTITVPGVKASVVVTSDAIEYHFVLTSGKTLPAGTYVFAGQYKHASGGRNAGDDTYEAIATDADHKRPHVYGNFYPTK